MKTLAAIREPGTQSKLLRYGDLSLGSGKFHRADRTWFDDVVTAAVPILTPRKERERESGAMLTRVLGGLLTVAFFGATPG